MFETKVLESKAPTDYESNLTQLANAGYNPIFAVGFLMTDTVTKVSTATPDVTFGGIDEFFDPTIPNVVGLNFKEQEAGYLAGVLAASLTSQPTVDPRINDKLIIGFVGGMEIPAGTGVPGRIHRRCQGGQPRRRSEEHLHGLLHRPAEGFRGWQGAHRAGCDIIFAAAGQTGLGTAKACQENKALFIGVDADQFLTIPAIGDTIITSAVKKIDVAVFETIKKAVDGTLKGGVNEALGIKEDAVGLAPYHDWDTKVPAETKKQVDAAKAGIADGSITVPSK